jgi:short-subunit dehydrogenase
MAELNGKVAWIQGGAGAVGLAIAEALVQAGAHVVISGRTGSGLDNAAVKVGGKIETLLLDVTDSNAVFKATDELEMRHGHIDILVNCAGINPSKRHWHDLSIQDWNDTVQVNLSGMFYACKATLRGMRERQDGVIINLSSWAGRYAAYFAGPAYASTKRAVLALTETINMEECVNGIRATSISPAGIDTPLLDKRPIPPSAEMRATMLKPRDIGDITRYVACLPPHVCINEILMSPRLNLPYLGELQTPRRPIARPD